MPTVASEAAETARRAVRPCLDALRGVFATGHSSISDGQTRNGTPPVAHCLHMHMTRYASAAAALDVPGIAGDELAALARASLMDEGPCGLAALSAHVRRSGDASLAVRLAESCSKLFPRVILLCAVAHAFLADGHDTAKPFDCFCPSECLSDEDSHIGEGPIIGNDRAKSGIAVQAEETGTVALMRAVDECTGATDHAKGPVLRAIVTHVFRACQSLPARLADILGVHTAHCAALVVHMRRAGHAPLCAVASDPARILIVRTTSNAAVHREAVAFVLRHVAACGDGELQAALLGVVFSRGNVPVLVSMLSNEIIAATSALSADCAAVWTVLVRRLFPDDTGVSDDFGGINGDVSAHDCLPGAPVDGFDSTALGDERGTDIMTAVVHFDAVWDAICADADVRTALCEPLLRFLARRRPFCAERVNRVLASVCDSPDAVRQACSLALSEDMPEPLVHLWDMPLLCGMAASVDVADTLVRRISRATVRGPCDPANFSSVIVRSSPFKSEEATVERALSLDSVTAMLSKRVTNFSEVLALLPIDGDAIPAFAVYAYRASFHLSSDIASLGTAVRAFASRVAGRSADARIAPAAYARCVSQAPEDERDRVSMALACMLPDAPAVLAASVLVSIGQFCAALDVCDDHAPDRRALFCVLSMILRVLGVDVPSDDGLFHVWDCGATSALRSKPSRGGALSDEVAGRMISSAKRLNRREDRDAIVRGIVLVVDETASIDAIVAIDNMLDMPHDAWTRLAVARAANGGSHALHECIRRRIDACTDADVRRTWVRIATTAAYDLDTSKRGSAAESEDGDVETDRAHRAFASFDPDAF